MLVHAIGIIKGKHYLIQSIEQMNVLYLVRIEGEGVIQNKGPLRGGKSHVGSIPGGGLFIGALNDVRGPLLK